MSGAARRLQCPPGIAAVGFHLPEEPHHSLRILQLPPRGGKLGLALLKLGIGRRDRGLGALNLGGDVVDRRAGVLAQPVAGNRQLRAVRFHVPEPVCERLGLVARRDAVPGVLRDLGI